MEAALRPAFYEDLRVPDTKDARLDMVILHVLLAVRALKDAGAQGPDPLGQALFDAMCEGLDAGYREEGFGDAKVARLVRGAAEQFYGRGRAYGAALDADDADALASALARNVYAGADVPPGGSRALASYVMRADRSLHAGSVRAGTLIFPSTGPDEDHEHAEARDAAAS